MAHFYALTELEHEIVRLGELRNMFAVIVNGAEESDRVDLISALNYIRGSLDDINDVMKEKFQQLFDKVKDDGN